MNRRYRRKNWNPNDSTNNVNRDQYIEAHLSSFGDVSNDSWEFNDDRPIRISSFNTSQVSPETQRSKSHWRSWDIAANDTLAAASGSSPSEERSTNSGILPHALKRSTLKMQLPMQHRIVNEFHDSIRDGMWDKMVGDDRKLVMRLINAFVRPVTAIPEQQSKLLAYYLYDIRNLLSVAQRLVVYQQLSECFEGTSPDHLAILLSGVAQFSDKEKSKVMSALRDEIRFAGSLPPSLVTIFALSAPLRGTLWQDALKILEGMPNKQSITNGAWATLARQVFSATKSIEPVQAVVDSATSMDQRQFQNIDLWNSYLVAAPLPHALEMVAKNMPKYKVRPNLQSYAEITKKCVENKDWATALELFQKAHALRPAHADPPREQDAYRLCLMSTLRALKASDRTNEINFVKKLVPNLRTILKL